MFFNKLFSIKNIANLPTSLGEMSEFGDFPTSGGRGWKNSAGENFGAESPSLPGSGLSVPTHRSPLVTFGGAKRARGVRGPSHSLLLLRLRLAWRREDGGQFSLSNLLEVDTEGV